MGAGVVEASAILIFYNVTKIGFNACAHQNWRWFMKWRKLDKAKADLQKFDDNLSWETLKKWATEIKPIIRHFFSEDLEEFNALMEEPRRRRALLIGSSQRINYPWDDILLYFASDREPEPNHKDEEASQLEWEKESDKKYQQEVVKRKEEFLTFLNHLLMLEEVYESDKKNNKQENDSTKTEMHIYGDMNLKGNMSKVFSLTYKMVLKKMF
jgi:hypothetical protein